MKRLFSLIPKYQGKHVQQSRIHSNLQVAFESQITTVQEGTKVSMIAVLVDMDFPLGSTQRTNDGREQQMIDQTQLYLWNTNHPGRGRASNTGKSFVIIAVRNEIMPGVERYFTGYIATLRRVT